MQEDIKLSFKESLKIVFWSTKFIFKLQKARVTLDIILTTINQNTSIVYSFIFAKLIDEVIKIVNTNSYSINAIYPYFVFLILYAISTEILNYLSKLNHRILSQNIDLLIDIEFINKITALNIAQLEDTEISNIISRGRSGLADLSISIATLTNFFSDILSAVITFFIVVNFLPSIVPLIIFLVLIQSRLEMLSNTKIHKLFYNTVEERRINSYSANYLEQLHYLPEIKINNLVSYLYDKYVSFTKNFNYRFLSLYKKHADTTFVTGISKSLLIYYGCFLIISNAISKLITIGDITFQISMLRGFNSDIWASFTRFNLMFERVLKLNDVYKLFQITAPQQNETYNLSLLQSGPKIEIRNLSFKYSDSNNYTLKDINLVINPKEKVAIVGHNGAGKTTLIKIISKIYQDYEGEILVNGIPLNEITKESYYNNLGVLFQEYNKYQSLTVKENIALGNINKKAEDDSINQSAQKADAIEFIDEFEYKFDQILMPNVKKGTKPSTGQWQKLAIARFFYRNSPIVIFDEPTSSIDAISEYEIFNKFYDFFTDKTVILISHKFSTVKNADKIIVLQKGRIVEVGTHKELLKNNGIYAHSFNLQADGYK